MGSLEKNVVHYNDWPNAQGVCWPAFQISVEELTLNSSTFITKKDLLWN